MPGRLRVRATETGLVPAIDRTCRQGRNRRAIVGADGRARSPGRSVSARGFTPRPRAGGPPSLRHPRCHLRVVAVKAPDRWIAARWHDRFDTSSTRQRVHARADHRFTRWRVGLVRRHATVRRSRPWWTPRRHRLAVAGRGIRSRATSRGRAATLGFASGSHAEPRSRGGEPCPGRTSGGAPPDLESRHSDPSPPRLRGSA